MAKRTPPFPFGNLEHVSMVVEDLQKTVRFYQRLFGFTVERELGNSELGVRAVVLAKKGRRIELFEYQGDRRPTSKRKAVLRGKKLAAEDFRPGIRGVAFRARAEEEDALPKIQRAHANLETETPALPSAGKEKLSKKVFLRDPNGGPLRPLGPGRRRKGASVAGQRIPASRPASRKRKVKQ